MGPDTGVNIFPRPHGLSVLRVEEGEFGGEFEGNSREFDGGFGEFDALQYVRGAMNPSTGARWGRGKVSFYKIKRGEKVGLGVGGAKSCPQPAFSVFHTPTHHPARLLEFYQTAVLGLV